MTTPATPNTDRILALAKNHPAVAEALETLLTDIFEVNLTDEDFPDHIAAPFDSLIGLQEAVDEAEGES